MIMIILSAIVLTSVVCNVKQYLTAVKLKIAIYEKEQVAVSLRQFISASEAQVGAALQTNKKLKSEVQSLVARSKNSKKISSTTSTPKAKVRNTKSFSKG
jgi:hypothetical protein